MKKLYKTIIDRTIRQNLFVILKKCFDYSNMYLKMFLSCIKTSYTGIYQRLVFDFLVS